MSEVERLPPRKTRKTDTGAEPVEPINQTLYVQNLNDKVRKEELKKCLYHAFSTYGHVIDIVALKTPKMRGQAHIVFADPLSASMGLKGLQGFNFFGKELRISYARSKSHAIAQIDGTFRMPAPRENQESTLPLAPFEAELGDKRKIEF